MYTMFFWTALRLCSKTHTDTNTHTDTHTIILTSSTISIIQVRQLFRVEMKRVYYLINRLWPVFLSGFYLAPDQQKKIWATKCNYWICSIEPKQHSDSSLSFISCCSYQTQAHNLPSIGIWSQNGSQYHWLQILRHNPFIWELSGVYDGYLFTAVFLRHSDKREAFILKVKMFETKSPPSCLWTGLDYP